MTVQDLVTSILDIMGLQPGDVNDNDTLVSMGIDSMQLVEVVFCPSSLAYPVKDSEKLLHFCQSKPRL